MDEFQYVNVALKLKRGQPNLLANPKNAPESEWLTTTQADFKKPPSKVKSLTLKKQALYDTFLYEQVSKEIANKVFKPRSPPTYITTTMDHYNASGFQPKELDPPAFTFSNYKQPVTYWSENKRAIQGVTTSAKVEGFPKCSPVTKPICDT